MYTLPDRIGGSLHVGHAHTLTTCVQGSRTYSATISYLHYLQRCREHCHTIWHWIQAKRTFYNIANSFDETPTAS